MEKENKKKIIANAKKRNEPVMEKKQKYKW